MSINDTRRYFYLQLHERYLERPVFLKIKKYPNGKAMILAYLELMLLAGNTRGTLTISGYYNSIAEELHDLLKGYTQEEVEITVNTCLQYGLITQIDDSSFFFPEAQDLTSSITGAAKRKRDYRERSTALKELPTPEDTKGDNQGTLSPTVELQIQDKEIYNNNNNNTDLPSLEDIPEQSTMDTNRQIDPVEDYRRVLTLLRQYGVEQDSFWWNYILENHSSKDVITGINQALKKRNKDTFNLAGVIIRNITKDLKKKK